MRLPCALFAAALLLADATAFAQERGRERARIERQEVRPRERVREDRREVHRERMLRKDGERGRFSREEREQLRQDLLEANREMKRRR